MATGVRICRAVFCLCMVESDLENHEYGWLCRNRSWIRHEDGCVVVGVEVGWSVVEEWLLSEVGIPACAFLRAAPGGAYGER